MTTAREAIARLEQAGVPNAAYDARALLRHATETGADVEELLAAREARTPLQHLIGTTGFRYLELAVGPGVFVPRPESELLVDTVLAALDGVSAPVVVDLCAGSGAIGLSVAHEHPSATVHLVERADDAFAWLTRNAAGHERVHLHHADLADAPPGLEGRLDVVVSNPPYVALHERELVDPEVRDHDPGVALWAGADGLDVIRQVADRARELLRPGGLVVVEHSDRHGEVAPAVLREAGFLDVADHEDLTQRPRFAVGVAP
ncbi:MAG: peptide chain release factor N(5)-glutamine methyltransferase [Frankiaceae bacterium]|nr:peptide chain release factor N(5)-glutamine methyltransferase [Frankiaceae bacterium]MBV9871505.1 peptide chain release factor N(5)-glutamine methyltransferase [Frankiaceae bacterium]